MAIPIPLRSKNLLFEKVLVENIGICYFGIYNCWWFSDGCASSPNLK